VTIIVFAGPSLDAGALAPPALELRPPAAEGDLYRAAREGPQAIALIDGYFEAQPAVWHKEILWAMSRGIPVFGAASMGALRAAELWQFGMVGVGAIYRAYRRGVLTDDSEVAVLHGPPELGYPSLTEALVNVRATLARAAALRIISPATRRLVLASAARLFYKERTWERVLSTAGLEGVEPAEAEHFARWIKTGRVDLKRRDATKLMQVLLQNAVQATTSQVCFEFEDTTNWRRLVARHAETI
jgi:hypothetical protein